MVYEIFYGMILDFVFEVLFVLFWFVDVKIDKVVVCVVVNGGDEYGGCVFLKVCKKIVWVCYKECCFVVQFWVLVFVCCYVDGDMYFNFMEILDYKVIVYVVFIDI